MDTGKAIVVAGSLIAVAVFLTNRYEFAGDSTSVAILDKVTGEACSYVYMMHELTKAGCTSDR